MVDEYMEPAAPQEGMNNTVKIVLIVVAVLVLCCICACIISMVFPALLGPSIGNVFSEILTEISP